MKRTIVSMVMAMLAGCAHGQVIDADVQSTSCSRLTVYEAEAGTLLVRLYRDQKPIAQTNTLTLWWGTNGLGQGSIHTIVGSISNATASLPYVAGDFPTNTTSRPFKYGILVGDKVWGDGDLWVKDNPTVGAGILDLYVRTVVDYASATQYQGVGTSGPIRAGTNISSVTNADGSVTFSLNTTIATQAGNGNTAHGWGNHATNGYITAVVGTNIATAVLAAYTNRVHPDGGYGVTSLNLNVNDGVYTRDGRQCEGKPVFRRADGVVLMRFNTDRWVFADSTNSIFATSGGQSSAGSMPLSVGWTAPGDVVTVAPLE